MFAAVVSFYWVIIAGRAKIFLRNKLWIDDFAEWRMTCNKSPLLRQFLWPATNAQQTLEATIRLTRVFISKCQKHLLLANGILSILTWQFLPVIYRYSTLLVLRYRSYLSFFKTLIIKYVCWYYRWQEKTNPFWWETGQLNLTLTVVKFIIIN